jgi:hypothetical protein
MKRLAFALAMSAIILTGLISTAQATTIGTQPAIPILDHLVCYTMKDPLTLQTSTDLLAELQPEFSQQGCILGTCRGKTRTEAIGQGKRLL